MVWNTSTSTLYRAVERHNNSEHAPNHERREPPAYGELPPQREQPEHKPHEHGEALPKREKPHREPPKYRESPPRREQPRQEACHEPRQDRGQPSRCGAVRRDPVSELLKDRDSLLIAALILVLLHEKADNKLILALAYVLLG